MKIPAFFAFVAVIACVAVPAHAQTRPAPRPAPRGPSVPRWDLSVGSGFFSGSALGDTAANLRGRSNEPFQLFASSSRLGASAPLEVRLGYLMNSRYALEVRGYADGRGSDRYNYKLGRERAEEVVRYMMVHHNVPMARIATVSFGEESPVADNSSTDGRAQNRRVQVRVLELSTSPPTAAMPTP